MSTLHRSRQKIPVQNRAHIHDGLRYMPLDIPREQGWYIPKDACGSLLEVSDVLEDKLYKAHDHAHRVGTQLTRAQRDATVEYDRTGKVSGLTFDEWLGRSRSIVAEMYKEKAKMMDITMGNVMTALDECDEAKTKIEKDVYHLKLEFAEATMHCRRVSAQEFEALDVRVRAEVAAFERDSIAVPVHHVSSLSESRTLSHGHLRTLIDDGCHTFVGVSCPVDAVAIGSCITVKQNPCLLPRLGLKEDRKGKCLKTLFLAENALGAHGLNTIAQGLQSNGQLEVFHCIANDVGEIGKQDDSDDHELTASLAALDRIAIALLTEGCRLRVLNLSGNNIGPAGAACLAKGLAASPQLELLDISNNVLGVAGANHVAVALTQNSALEVLNMNSTQIGRAGLRAVVSALVFNTSLSVLFAVGNVGPSALAELQAALKDNATLREVHLFDATPWINPSHPAERELQAKQRKLAAQEDEDDWGEDQAESDARTRSSAAIKSAERPRIGWTRIAHEGFRLSFFRLDPNAAVKEERVASSAGEVALQLELQQKRLEEARKKVRGIASETAMDRIHKAGLGNREVVQYWGPPLTLGVNMPTACQIIGYYAGGKDKSQLQCEWCKTEQWKAAVGEYGHEAYECPRRFYQETGELMPGFTEIGGRDEECWNAAGSEPVDAVADMWGELKDKGYFRESGDPPPQDTRTKPLPDFASNGVARKPWSERGSYRSIDALKRRQLYDSRGSSDPFAGGSAVLNDFLKSRAKEHEDVRLHSKMAERMMSTKGYIPGINDRMLKFMQKVRHNHVDDVEAFLAGKYGSVDINASDMEGNVAIIVAAQNGHKRLVRMLNKAGASLDQQDHRGNTALHYTFAFKLQALSTYLLNKGADDSMTNIKGLTCYEGLA